MKLQSERLQYLLEDNTESAIREWKKQCPATHLADLIECQELIDLEVAQLQIRISVVSEQLNYMRRMVELDALSGGKVFARNSDPDPEDSGDDGHDEKRA